MSIWVHHQSEFKSDEVFFGSDSASNHLENNSDLDVHDSIYESSNCESQEKFQPNSRLSKLSTVKLDSISIPSSAANPQPIVNLKQSFNFAAPFKPTSQEISTQTSQLELAISRKLFTDNEDSRRMFRSSSLPPENAALTNLSKRVQADVKLKLHNEAIGDGYIDFKKETLEEEARKPDLEISYTMPVQCVVLKPK